MSKQDRMYLVVGACLTVAALSYLAWRGLSTGDWSAFIRTVIGIVVLGVLALVGLWVRRRQTRSSGRPPGEDK